MKPCNIDIVETTRAYALKALQVPPTHGHAMQMNYNLAQIRDRASSIKVKSYVDRG
jgi:hypothetical protein